MCSENLKNLESKLYNPLPIPIVGRILQRRAIIELAENSSSDTLTILAKAVTRFREHELKEIILDSLNKTAIALVRNGSPDDVKILAKTITFFEERRVIKIILASLSSIEKQKCIDSFCEVWVDTRHKDLSTLLLKKEWTASASTACNVMILSVLKTNRLEKFTLYYTSKEIAKYLFKAMKDEDPDIANRAIKLVNSFNDWDFGYRFLYSEKELKYELCLEWSETRDKFYEEIICKNKYVLSSIYAPTGGYVKDLFVLVALKTAQFELIQNAERDIVESLAKAYYDQDAEIADRAGKCELREPSQKALFYFLTEQWDKYENLDYEYSLLQKVYELGDEKLRKQIADKARQAGRVEWIQIVAGGRGKSKRLGEMSDAEWKVTIDILSKNKKWEQIWQLAQKAPAFRSRQLLRKLNQVKRLPQSEQEKVGFQRLQQLSEKCSEKIESMGKFICHQKHLNGYFTNDTHQISFSPNGKLLAIASSTNIRLWHMPSGRSFIDFNCFKYSNNNCVLKMVFSPDSKMLASCNKDGSIKLLPMPHISEEENEHHLFSVTRNHDHQSLNTLTGFEGSVNAIVFSPDGQIFAACGDDKTIRLWKMPDGNHLATLTGHTDSVRGVAFSPDGKILASCSKDGSIRLWKMPDGNHLATLTGHTDLVRGVAFSPDGKILASHSKYPDTTIRLWRMPNGHLLKALNCNNPNGCEGMTFSSNGKILASHGYKTIELWEMPDGHSLATITAHTHYVNDIAFRPDSKLLASCSKDGSIRLWKMPNGHHVANICNHSVGGIGEFEKISFSPDGKTLVSCGRKNNLWSSDLPRLINHPITNLNQEDKKLIQTALQDDNVTQGEKHWLEFMQALINWHRRFDVLIDDVPLLISTGEFDIEIEG